MPGVAANWSRQGRPLFVMPSSYDLLAAVDVHSNVNDSGGMNSICNGSENR
jgi:hypothetical protein